MEDQLRQEMREDRLLRGRLRPVMIVLCSLAAIKLSRATESRVSGSLFSHYGFGMTACVSFEYPLSLELSSTAAAT